MCGKHGSDGTPEAPAAAGADRGTGSGAADGEGCVGPGGAGVTVVAGAAGRREQGRNSKMQQAVAVREPVAEFAADGAQTDEELAADGAEEDPPNRQTTHPVQGGQACRRYPNSPEKRSQVRT